MIETTLQKNQPVPVAIVSRPGIMQQSLRSSLTACSSLVIVASFGDGLTALNQLAQLLLGILVIDSNLLDEEVDALLAAVKRRQPAIRCLALVRSGSRQRQLLTQGADAVISRSESAQELLAALSRLVQEPEDQQA